MITEVPRLTSTEAARRLAEIGANELPSGETLHWYTALRHQLIDPVMGVLLVALGLTLAIGDWPDAAVIGMVIVLNSALGTVQDLRSARAVAALADLTAPHATVVRDGHRVDIPAREVVPDDLVVLSAGDIVPADAELIEANAVQLDESMLTGESVPVDRAAGAPVYAGTVVRRGRGAAVVTGTGTATEIGRIAGGLGKAQRVRTPLQRQLAGLGRFLAGLVAVIAIAVAALNIVAGHGVEYSITLALSLAVAAIPESLPAVVTLALALAARRMVSAGVLARRLAAVESLGSVTVLAADKTGTLTRGQMSLAEAWTPDGEAETRRRLLAAAVLCNDAAADGTGPRDDPVETALVHAAEQAGLDVTAVRAACPRLAEEPFDAELARMTTVHRTVDGNTVRYCKGSPESLATLGATASGASEAAARMSQSGVRVLAVAERADGDWVLLGLLGLADPPRAEAAAVVAAFRRAGVRPVMITGDHPLTAARIAAAVDIAPDDVHARVRPDHKNAVVAELRRQGEIVAMTGDGVNDAPALRGADVGVAMGLRGTEVAKQAADLVLVQDDLSALVAAIAEGRRAYDNVRRFLRYALSGGLAEVLIMLVGPALGFAVPLQPGQILWVNLLTHGVPGVAMGSEAAEPDVLSRRPRSPQARLVDRPLAVRVAAFAVLITASCLAAAFWAKAVDRPWQSYLFVTLTLTQLALGLVLRPRWRLRDPNPMLLAAVLINVVLVFAAVAWEPLEDLLRTEPMNVVDAVRCLAVVAAFTVVAAVLHRLTDSHRARSARRPE